MTGFLNGGSKHILALRNLNIESGVIQEKQKTNKLMALQRHIQKLTSISFGVYSQP